MRIAIYEDLEQTELDSDIRALKLDRVVAVTPLSLDLTSRVALNTLFLCLRAGSAASAPQFSPLLVASLDLAASI